MSCAPGMRPDKGPVPPRVEVASRAASVCRLRGREAQPVTDATEVRDDRQAQRTGPIIAIALFQIRRLRVHDAISRAPIRWEAAI